MVALFCTFPISIYIDLIKKYIDITIYPYNPRGRGGPPAMLVVALFCALPISRHIIYSIYLRSLTIFILRKTLFNN